MRLSSENRRVLGHALIGLLFAGTFLLLNRPEVIVISRLGLVAWYPAVGVTLAVLVGFTPWYALVAALCASLSGIIIYHQPLVTVSGTIGSAALAVSYALAAHVLRGPLRIDSNLGQRRDVLRYVAITTVAALASGLAGALCLVGDGSIPWGEFWYSACIWFLGDEIAILGLAPFLLIHVVPPVRKFLGLNPTSVAAEPKAAKAPLDLWTSLEAAAQALALVAALWVMFGSRFGQLELSYLG